MSEKITKIDAARRQLVTAVRLFFEDRDSVSVYSLACNASEIINVLCKARDIETFTDMMCQSQDKYDRDGINKLINNARTFFKHTGKENLSLEDFSDEQNDTILWIATHDFSLLNHHIKPLEFHVFKYWYLSQKARNFFDAVKHKEIIELIDVCFPNINLMDRTKRKSEGLRVLKEAENDPEILNDPKIDQTELLRWKII